MPTLTTVEPGFGSLGQRAVKLLLERISGNEDVAHSTAAPQLILRESVAPPPPAGRS